MAAPEPLRGALAHSAGICWAPLEVHTQAQPCPRQPALALRTAGCTWHPARGTSSRPWGRSWDPRTATSRHLRAERCRQPCAPEPAGRACVEAPGPQQGCQPLRRRPPGAGLWVRLRHGPRGAAACQQYQVSSPAFCLVAHFKYHSRSVHTLRHHASQAPAPWQPHGGEAAAPPSASLPNRRAPACCGSPACRPPVAGGAAARQRAAARASSRTRTSPATPPLHSSGLWFARW